MDEYARHPAYMASSDAPTNSKTHGPANAKLILGGLGRVSQKLPANLERPNLSRMNPVERDNWAKSPEGRRYERKQLEYARSRIIRHIAHDGDPLQA